MRIFQSILILVSLLAMSISVSFAEQLPKFVGKVILIPSGCQDGPKCTLKEDFAFIDKRKYGWKVNAGQTTDGASIPKLLRFLAGEPYRPEYINAAVIHDYYSKSRRPVYSWWRTQRMFYEVLRLTGVSRMRASALYAGLLVGAPKWIGEIVKPKPCNVGPGIACLQSAGEVKIIYKEATYKEPQYKKIVAKLRAAISENEDITPEEIEELAKPYLGDDRYLTQKYLPELPRFDGPTSTE